jgi:hypothetical protein
MPGGVHQQLAWDARREVVYPFLADEDFLRFRKREVAPCFKTGATLGWLGSALKPPNPYSVLIASEPRRDLALFDGIDDRKATSLRNDRDDAAKQMGAAGSLHRVPSARGPVDDSQH